MRESFPFRQRALYAFEEVDGVDVCFFGLHVQESETKDLSLYDMILWSQFTFGSAALKRSQNDTKIRSKR